MTDLTAQTAALDSPVTSRTWMTIGLCFIVALLEGLDLQAAGIAAAGMRVAFDLSSSGLGAIFSAGILGLLPGALLGGRFADRIGRKKVLVAATLVFGLCSIASAYAWDLSSLIAFRFMTGIGLGAAMPNLIALPSEAAGPKLRSTAVSLMYCGVPLGAAGAALLSMAGLTQQWQTIYLIGGFAPLLVVPLLMVFLPESRDFEKNRSQDAAVSIRNGLFGAASLSSTLSIWVAYFFTLLVMYMLINWLPSLLMSRGLTSIQASQALFVMQIGGTLGSVSLGAAMDRLRLLPLMLCAYLGIFVSLLSLAFSTVFTTTLIAVFVAGFFVLGTQLMLYALTPRYYDTAIRATGVGAAVAVGRLGAMSGPLVAGQLLTWGLGAGGVIAGAIPPILLAAGASAYLMLKARKAH